MTAQRIRKWAAGTFLAALVVLAIVLLGTGTGDMLQVFGQLLAILLAGLAVLLMIISLFFPHEIE